eukprot:7380784-Prymnesium_polylepis.2
MQPTRTLRAAGCRATIPAAGVHAMTCMMRCAPGEDNVYCKPEMHIEAVSHTHVYVHVPVSVPCPSHVHVQAHAHVHFASANRKLDKQRITGAKGTTDPIYETILSLRSTPVQFFLAGTRSQWAIPITSINEECASPSFNPARMPHKALQLVAVPSLHKCRNHCFACCMPRSRLLKELGLPEAERMEIEGLQVQRNSDTQSLTDKQQSLRAIRRLVSNPSPQVGQMQRRTSGWLLRPYPLGLRFSGNNMSPLPGYACATRDDCVNLNPAGSCVLAATCNDQAHGSI